MTLWSFSEAATALLILSVGAKIYIRSKTSPTGRLVASFYMFLATLTFLEFQLLATGPNSSSMAYLWASLHQCWPLLMALLVHVSLRVARRKDLLKLLLLPCYAIAITLAGIGVFFPNFTLASMEYQSWGWLEKSTPEWTPIAAVFSQSYCIFASIILWLHFRRCRDRQEKRQALIMFLSILCYLLSAGSHPIHEHFFFDSMPPPHAYLALLSTLIVLYGMWRHQLFLNPEQGQKSGRVKELEIPNARMGAIRGNLTSRYVVYLLITGFALVFSYGAFIFYSRSMVSDGHLINISGRQRMLSQRIILLSMDRTLSPDSQSLHYIQKNLDQALLELEQTHHTLTSRREISPLHRLIYFGSRYALDQKIHEFLSEFRSPNTSLMRQKLYVSLHLSPLLEGLEKDVSLFQEENKIRGETLGRVQGTIVILGILGLIFAAAFVLRPMVVEFSSMADQLTKSNQNLLHERNQLNLLLKIMTIANTSKTLDSAIQETLHEVCRNTYWPVGHAYTLSPTDPNLLISTKLWHLEEEDTFGTFQAVTERTNLRPGEGLPGRVLSAHQSIWIPDVSVDANFPRNRVARDIGVRSGFAFPILSQGKTIAVLEFFSKAVIEKDPSLLELISNIGRALGQVYERETSAAEIEQANEFLEDRVEARAVELKFKNRELEEIAQKLKESEEKLRSLIDSTADAIFTTDKSGVFLNCSRAIFRTLGYSEEELIGKPLTTLLPESYKNSPLTTETVGVPLELEARHKNGERIPVEISLSTWNTRSGYHFSGILRDIRARKLAEKEKEEIRQQLIQAAKLASVGTLSAGVAHELNNPLTAIKGFAQVVFTKSKNRRIKERANHIIAAADRMKTIVDQLRNFSRKRTEADFIRFDINQCIRSSLIILESQLKVEDIQIELNLASEGAYLLGDPNQIESVFQNLISNSKDAFESIKDRRSKKIEFTTMLDSKGALSVKYQDNAGGMSKTTLGRIFEPFYTTKDIGKGTGLGMSISHNIIKQHKGDIEATSIPGHGTVFTLSFPSAGKGKPVLVVNEGKIIRKNRSRPKLLIVDDEELITELLQEFLADDYDLEVFNDSLKALARIKENVFDLILTDLKMPKASGALVIEAIRKHQPKTSIILLTGCGPDEELVEGIEQTSKVVVLYKPFHGREQVKRLIHSVLRKETGLKQVA